MKTITGSPARRERFYKRTSIRKKLLDALTNDENLLLTAPRRVGKSSVLLDLVDNPDKKFYAVFQDTEAIDHPDQFFKIILKAILNADHIEGFGHFKGNVKNKLHEWAKRLAGFSIAGFELELKEAEKISYYEELSRFLLDIKLDDKKIILLIDEFPITVEKIQDAHGEEAAKHFLSQNRALRQNPVFQEKIKFIYTGSIGLYTAVKKINSTDKVNDLREIKMAALTEEEASDFLEKLMKEECSQKITPALSAYILQKIQWWIPFYFQLMVRELSDLLDEGKSLNEKTIDKAFDKIAENGNIYFEHFKSRLLKVFKNTVEAGFVRELLLKIKKEDQLEYKDILNMAVRRKLGSKLDDILEILKHDGYLVEENNTYQFYSPILKKWWK